MKCYLLPLVSFVLVSAVASADINLKVTEMGFGWQMRVGDPENADPIIDLSDGSVDWMIAYNGDGFDGFNYFARKIGPPRLQFLGVSGDYFTIGSNSGDAMQVYFTATDAEILDTPIGELGIHFGVSWLGSNDGSGTFSWRMTVDADSFLFFHWWNHGSGFQRQTFRVTLYSADGTLRDTDQFEHVGESFATYLSEVLVTGAAPGDFVILEQQGHNAGWRGTMVVEMDNGGEPGPVPGEWTAHPVLGDLYFFGSGWWLSPTLGVLYIEGTAEWFYHVDLEWLSLPAGGASLSNENGVFLFSARSSGWIYFSLETLPAYHDFAAGSWRSLGN